jgi:hypothetical protein
MGLNIVDRRMTGLHGFLDSMAPKLPSGVGPRTASPLATNHRMVVSTLSDQSGDDSRGADLAVACEANEEMTDQRR